MFGYLASHATGILMLSFIVFFALLAIQWLSWIFRWGRFSESPPEDESPPREQNVLFILAELAANVINDFRHLLALVIVLLFGGVLAFGLVRAGSDAQGISAVLQAVASSLGGLVGAIIGYYFGESAGRRRTPDESVTVHDVEQSEHGVDGIRQAATPPPGDDKP